MSIDNITFENEDTIKDKVTKTVLLWAGTSEIAKELKKLGITNYHKVVRGFKTMYIVRGTKVGRVKVIL